MVTCKAAPEAHWLTRAAHVRVTTGSGHVERGGQHAAPAFEENPCVLCTACFRVPAPSCLAMWVQGRVRSTWGQLQPERPPRLVGPAASPGPRHAWSCLLAATACVPANAIASTLSWAAAALLPGDAWLAPPVGRAHAALQPLEVCHPAAASPQFAIIPYWPGALLSASLLMYHVMCSIVAFNTP